MEWTKDKPTEVGYYWIRNYQYYDGDTKFDGPPRIILVAQIMDLPFDVYLPGTPHQFSLDCLCGEFLGPLVAPDCEPRCNHPKAQFPSVAYACQELVDKVFPNKKECMGAVVIVDPNITDRLIHFPTQDGRCRKFNI